MEGGEIDAETVQEGTDSLGVLYSPGDRKAELQHGLRALYLRLQAELPCCCNVLPILLIQRQEEEGGKVRNESGRRCSRTGRETIT